nr:HcPro [Dendrobium chlorotic mosaic virus]
SIPTKFWEGFNRKFLELRPEETHTCQSNFPVELCGEAAAIFYQILHPCRKITCLACTKTIESYSDAEIRELQQVILSKHQDSVNTLSSTITGFGSALSRVRNMNKQNPNLKACMETQRLIQNVKKDQMRSIQFINDALIKYSYASEEEIALASEHLCKITQWFSNHLSTIAGSSLQAFRNKISGKALLNPSLLCDNQLDKNGNFIWGERGYHSKRFFSNFFEEVRPGDGYEKYKIRKSPNTERLLAIGNLIVSTNFERARQSMRGELIEKQPITEACVSRQEGSFVHVCCCVTTDDGKPKYSELKNPTKRHLVIGNTGDSKYVDLPDSDSGKMYIAKEGYCYLNIFLAMLLNVNESEAKNFTKMVRDVLVPNLGVWPTIMDVATACYILTLFHPETRNAELPRILVDHKSQTLHVIDSFGSLSTGYHILKAGTASQLINFSSVDLQGEMKHYRVG